MSGPVPGAYKVAEGERQSYTLTQQRRGRDGALDGERPEHMGHAADHHGEEFGDYSTGNKSQWRV